MFLRRKELADGILSLLKAREIDVSSADEVRIRSCEEKATLEKWLLRAASGINATEVLREE